MSENSTECYVGGLPRVGEWITVVDECVDNLMGQVRMAATVAAALSKG